MDTDSPVSHQVTSLKLLSSFSSIPLHFGVITLAPWPPDRHLLWGTYPIKSIWASTVCVCYCLPVIIYSSLVQNPWTALQFSPPQILTPHCRHRQLYIYLPNTITWWLYALTEYLQTPVYVKLSGPVNLLCPNTKITTSTLRFSVVELHETLKFGKFDNCSFWRAAPPPN